MSRTSIQKTFFSTTTALLLAGSLSACSTNPTERTAYDRQHRPNCELQGETKKVGNTTLFAPRHRVMASSAECQDWGGDMLISAAD